MQTVVMKAGVRVTISGQDPAAVEEAAREVKARFGKRFAVTRRIRSRKGPGLRVFGVILTDAGNSLDADVGDLLRMPETGR